MTSPIRTDGIQFQTGREEFEGTASKPLEQEREVKQKVSISVIGTPAKKAPSNSAQVAGSMLTPDPEILSRAKKEFDPELNQFVLAWVPIIGKKIDEKIEGISQTPTFVEYIQTIIFKALINLRADIGGDPSKISLIDILAHISTIISKKYEVLRKEIGEAEERVEKEKNRLASARQALEKVIQANTSPASTWESDRNISAVTQPIEKTIDEALKAFNQAVLERDQYIYRVCEPVIKKAFPHEYNDFNIGGKGSHDSLLSTHFWQPLAKKVTKWKTGGNLWELFTKPELVQDHENETWWLSSLYYMLKPLQRELNLNEKDVASDALLSFTPLLAKDSLDIAKQKFTPPKPKPILKASDPDQPGSKPVPKPSALQQTRPGLSDFALTLARTINMQLHLAPLALDPAAQRCVDLATEEEILGGTQSQFSLDSAAVEWLAHLIQSIFTNQKPELKPLWNLIIEIIQRHLIIGCKQIAGQDRNLPARKILFPFTANLRDLFIKLYSEKGVQFREAYRWKAQYQKEIGYHNICECYRMAIEGQIKHAEAENKAIAEWREKIELPRKQLHQKYQDIFEQFLLSQENEEKRKKEVDDSPQAIALKKSKALKKAIARAEWDGMQNPWDEQIYPLFVELANELLNRANIDKDLDQLGLTELVRSHLPQWIYDICNPLIEENMGILDWIDPEKALNVLQASDAQADAQAQLEAKERDQKYREGEVKREKEVVIGLGSMSLDRLQGDQKRTHAEKEQKRARAMERETKEIESADNKIRAASPILRSVSPEAPQPVTEVQPLSAPLEVARAFARSFTQISITKAQELFELQQKDPGDTYGALQDNSPAIDGLEKISIRTIHDFFDVGLLSPLSHNHAHFMQSAQKELENRGLFTIGDLKRAGIFSKNALQAWLRTHPISISFYGLLCNIFPSFQNAPGKLGITRPLSLVTASYVTTPREGLLKFAQQHLELFFFNLFKSDMSRNPIETSRNPSAWSPAHLVVNCLKVINDHFKTIDEHRKANHDKIRELHALVSDETALRGALHAELKKQQAELKRQIEVKAKEERRVRFEGIPEDEVKISNEEFNAKLEEFKKQKILEIFGPLADQLMIKLGLTKPQFTIFSLKQVLRELLATQLYSFFYVSLSQPERDSQQTHRALRRFFAPQHDALLADLEARLGQVTSGERKRASEDELKLRAQISLRKLELDEAEEKAVGLYATVFENISQSFLSTNIISSTRQFLSQSDVTIDMLNEKLNLQLSPDAKIWLKQNLKLIFEETGIGEEVIWQYAQFFVGNLLPQMFVALLTQTFPQQAAPPPVPEDDGVGLGFNRDQPRPRQEVIPPPRGNIALAPVYIINHICKIWDDFFQRVPSGTFCLERDGEFLDIEALQHLHANKDRKLARTIRYLKKQQVIKNDPHQKEKLETLQLKQKQLITDKIDLQQRIEVLQKALIQSRPALIPIIAEKINREQARPLYEELLAQQKIVARIVELQAPHQEQIRIEQKKNAEQYPEAIIAIQDHQTRLFELEQQKIPHQNEINRIQAELQKVQSQLAPYFAPFLRNVGPILIPLLSEEQQTFIFTEQAPRQIAEHILAKIYIELNRDDKVKNQEQLRKELFFLSGQELARVLAKFTEHFVPYMLEDPQNRDISQAIFDQIMSYMGPAPADASPDRKRLAESPAGAQVVQFLQDHGGLVLQTAQTNIQEVGRMALPQDGTGSPSFMRAWGNTVTEHTEVLILKMLGSTVKNLRRLHEYRREGLITEGMLHDGLRLMIPVISDHMRNMNLVASELGYRNVHSVPVPIMRRALENLPMQNGHPENVLHDALRTPELSQEELRLPLPDQAALIERRKEELRMKYLYDPLFEKLTKLADLTYADMPGIDDSTRKLAFDQMRRHGPKIVKTLWEKIGLKEMRGRATIDKMIVTLCEKLEKNLNETSTTPKENAPRAQEGESDGVKEDEDWGELLKQIRNGLPLSVNGIIDLITSHDDTAAMLGKAARSYIKTQHFVDDTFRSMIIEPTLPTLHPGKFDNKGKFIAVRMDAATKKEVEIPGQEAFIQHRGAAAERAQQDLERANNAELSRRKTELINRVVNLAIQKGFEYSLNQTGKTITKGVHKVLDFCFRSFSGPVKTAVDILLGLLVKIFAALSYVFVRIWNLYQEWRVRSQLDHLDRNLSHALNEDLVIKLVMQFLDAALLRLEQIKVEEEKREAELKVEKQIRAELIRQHSMGRRGPSSGFNSRRNSSSEQDISRASTPMGTPLKRRKAEHSD